MNSLLWLVCGVLLIGCATTKPQKPPISVVTHPTSTDVTQRIKNALKVVTWNGFVYPGISVAAEVDGEFGYCSTFINKPPVHSSGRQNVMVKLNSDSIQVKTQPRQYFTGLPHIGNSVNAVTVAAPYSTGYIAILCEADLITPTTIPTNSWPSASTWLLLEGEFRVNTKGYLILLITTPPDTLFKYGVNDKLRSSPILDQDGDLLGFSNGVTINRGYTDLTFLQLSIFPFFENSLEGYSGLLSDLDCFLRNQDRTKELATGDPFIVPMPLPEDKQIPNAIASVKEIASPHSLGVYLNTLQTVNPGYQPDRQAEALMRQANQDNLALSAINREMYDIRRAILFDFNIIMTDVFRAQYADPAISVGDADSDEYIAAGLARLVYTEHTCVPINAPMGWQDNNPQLVIWVDQYHELWKKKQAIFNLSFGSPID